VVGATLLTAQTENALSDASGGGPGTLPAAPKRLAATPRLFEYSPSTSHECETLGSPSRCFEFLSRTALNPASFFDHNEVSEDTHFFMKLYRNDTGDTLVVTGMGFEARSERQSSNKFEGAGVIFAGEDAIFPSTDALRNLPVARFDGQPPDTMTCVEFPSALDMRGNVIGDDMVLAPQEAAWLVLQFIPSDFFVGILVDISGTDHPCDYMTIDGGETWYQPDPVHGPFYDWGITAFTNAGPRSPRPPAPTWSSVKRLYTRE
jgi:hypothetical protein